MSRRVLAVAASLCLIPAVALAASHTGTRKYNGPAAGGVNNAGVEFKVHTKNGHAQYLKLFEFHNIPASCGAVTGELDKQFDIDDMKKFHGSGTVNGGKLTVHFHGRLKDGEKKAVGKLHVQGTAPACPDTDTGVVSWHAHAVQ